MIALGLAGRRESIRVLCIGAHCDDIEIGCAGTLLQLQASAAAVTIDWVVLSGNAARQAETEAARDLLLAPAARGELLFGEFPDARFPSVYSELKDYFNALSSRFKPDLIFCHEKNDAHQDHRMVNEMVWGGFRNQLILEYEIIKWDGGLTTPNLYVPMDPEVLDRKVDALMRAYGSQRSKDWFTPESFRGIARTRGVECRAAGGFAEGFTARKVLFDPGFTATH